MDVLHRCDNPPCVRPKHLFLGTDADNQRDAREKGRHVDPPRSPRALTPEQVKEARRLHEEDQETFRTLGRRYGVAHTVVLRAIRGDPAETGVQAEPRS